MFVDGVELAEDGVAEFADDSPAALPIPAAPLELQ
jgi:hypothetical protein